MPIFVNFVSTLEYFEKNIWTNFSSNLYNVPWFSSESTLPMEDTFEKKESYRPSPLSLNAEDIETTEPSKSPDAYFSQMLDFVLSWEGGYSNKKSDRGGETMKGVTHNTYDDYRRKKGLPLRSVKYITHQELLEIYQKEFFEKIGADKISDPKMALLLFDTAVNMGVNGASSLYSKSGGDYDKFLQLRKERYKQIAQKPNQMIYLKGWLNRVAALEAYVKEHYNA